MKKLMIAAAIVCAAAFAQAAATTWQFQSQTPIYNANIAGTPFAEGATAYLVMYGEYESGFMGLSQANLLTKLQNGGSMTDVGIAEYVYNGTGTVKADGTIDKVSVSFDDSWIEDGYAAYYMVVVQDKNVFIGGEDWQMVNGLKPAETTFNPMTGDTEYSIDKTGKASYSDPGWYATAAVPEPTSGILLLLGVAGLALRRRRA